MKELKLLFKERTTWIGVVLISFAMFVPDLSVEVQISVISAGTALIARNEQGVNNGG